MTKRTFRAVALLAAFLYLRKAEGQVSTPFNNPTFPGSDYVGWNGGTTVPLMVRHNANQRIEWYTDSLRRMLLTPTLTNQTWAWWQAGDLDFSGHLGLGAQTPTQPLTYLHINHGWLGGISVGYRPWMRTGVFMSEASDAMYVGLRRSTSNQAHAIINWSDDVSGMNPDALRFTFTSTPDSASIARTFEGLEIARMIPAAGGNEGFLGVGDFFTAGLQPTERLDLLTGRARIRQLPDSSGEAQDAYKVMVVDDSSDPDERGVVKWKDINLDSDCDWVVQTPDPHVSSTYDGSDCAWSSKHGVGIGLAVPKFKLHVYHTENTLLSPVAIHGDARFDLDNGGELFGLLGQARPTGSVGTILDQQAYGGAGVASIRAPRSACAASAAPAPPPMAWPPR